MKLDFNYLVSQLAHIGWGAYLTLELSRHMGLGWAVALVALFSAGKESIESLWGVWEPKAPWWDGLIDFAFFVVGILLACYIP